MATLCAEWLAAAFWRIDCLAKLDLFDIEIDAIDELLDAVCTSATLEVVAVTIAQLAPQHLVVDDLATVDVFELIPRTREQIEL